MAKLLIAGCLALAFGSLAAGFGHAAPPKPQPRLKVEATEQGLIRSGAVPIREGRAELVVLGGMRYAVSVEALPPGNAGGYLAKVVVTETAGVKKNAGPVASPSIVLMPGLPAFVSLNDAHGKLVEIAVQVDLAPRPR